MSLLTQRPITLINDCSAIYDDALLIDAILWFSDRPVQATKHVYMYGSYAAVSIGKTKIHIHRLIGYYISKNKFERNLHVHHKDGNRLNNKQSNLEIVNCKEHLSKHRKGRKPSAKSIAATIAFNHTRKGKRVKSKRDDISPFMVYIMYKNGMSFNAISKKLKLDWGCVKQRYNDYIHDNPELLKGGNQ